jgi:Tfp pilus assembly protein PilF
MIVKNEAPVLAASLESLRGLAFEIVVVDGGSTDGSVEIAEAAGARVFHDPGDLSASRNRALREARGDHCLMIDGDETVVRETWPSLVAFLREGRHPRGRIQQVSETADGIATLWITRVCKNDPAFHYEGSAHEQLLGPGSVANTGLQVLHSGYSPATLARKGSSERNLRLIREAIARNPAEPYLRYQLGKTLLVSGRPSEAVEPFASALPQVPTGAAYLGAFVCDYGYALKGAGRPAEALSLVRRFQPQFPDYTDLWFLEGLCHLATGNVPEMLAAFERCLSLGEAPLHATVQGVGSFRALYNLGLYHELCGDTGQARRLYERALSVNPSFVQAARRLEALR